MFEKIHQSENNYYNRELSMDKKLYPHLVFDTQNYYVWFIW